MTVYAGILSALLAPLLEAAGFLEWDIHWKRGGGSAFALNMFKCNLAALGFLLMTVFANNSGYIRYASEWTKDGHSPYGYKPKGHVIHVESMGRGAEDGMGEDPADKWARHNWQDYLKERTEKMLSSRTGEDEDPNGPMPVASDGQAPRQQPGKQQAMRNDPPPPPPPGRPLSPQELEQMAAQARMAQRPRGSEEKMPQQFETAVADRQRWEQKKAEAAARAEAEAVQKDGPRPPQEMTRQQQQQQQILLQQQQQRQQQQHQQNEPGPQQLQGPGPGPQPEQQAQQADQRRQQKQPPGQPLPQQQGQGQQPQAGPNARHQQQQQAVQQRQQQQQAQQQAQHQQGQKPPPQQQQGPQQPVQQQGQPQPPQQQQQQQQKQQQQQHQQQQGPGPQQQPQASRRRLQQEEHPRDDMRFPRPQLRQEPINSPPPRQQQQQQRARQESDNQPSPDDPTDDLFPPPNLPYLPPDAYSRSSSYSKYSWDNVGPIILGSFLGILIGDCAELEALRLIGARRVLIVDTAKPFAAAFLGTIVLGEPMHFAAVLGMILTAYGVFVVLKDSMERLERAVERRRRDGAKRALSGAGSLSRASSIGSVGSADDGGGGTLSGSSGGIRSAASTPKLMMVGMRRGSISRHDLSSEYNDAISTASGFGGYDDDIGLFLEDGREFADPEGSSMADFVSCGSYGNLRRRYSFGSTGSGGGRKDSFGGSSVGSFDSTDYNMGFDDDPEGDYFFGSSGNRSPRTNSSVGAESAQEAASHNVVVEMPFKSQHAASRAQSPRSARYPTPTKTRAKSALRKSRFSVTAFDPSADEEATATDKKETAAAAVPSAVSSSNGSSASDFEKSLIGTIGVSMVPPDDRQQLPPAQIPARARLSSNSGASIVSSASFRSMSTLGTECGPPPDWYPGRARETREGREIRLKLGYGLALLNVLFDAYASLLTKRHGSGMTTWEINLIRMGFAGVSMLAISGFLRLRDYMAWRARSARRKSRPAGAGKNRYFDQEWSSDDGLESLEHYNVPDVYAWYRMPTMSVRPWVVVSVGVLFVSFLSPALSNYALFEIAIALAVTLGSVTPLFTLPLGWLLKGERPTRKGVTGAATATLGIVVLCLWGIEMEE